MCCAARGVIQTVAYFFIFKILNMYLSNYKALCFALSILFVFSACRKEDDVPEPAEPQEFGTFDLVFDNVYGDGELSLVGTDDENFDYVNGNNQDFNITLLGYYITKIELTGPNGEYYADEMATSADPDEVKGFYHVLESDANSRTIRLNEVPAGKYDRVNFTIGVDADAVSEGATGGVLDPAEGGWLWNWDAGYIGFAFEGRSPASPAEATQWAPENAVQLHIGGWKDLPDNPSMVNNVKRNSIPFPSSVSVGERLEPNAHIEMNLLTMIAGPHATVDFSTTFSVHAPALGSEIAKNLATAFTVDHVHQ